MTTPGDDNWVTLGESSAYLNDWMSVSVIDVRTPSGRRYGHHVANLRPAVLVVLVDGDRKRVLLGRRYRLVNDEWSWEVPGGFIEPDESSYDAVIRELLEETGYQPGSIEEIYAYEPMIGNVRSRHHIFLAFDPVRVADPSERDEGTFDWVDIAEVRRLIEQRQVPAAGPLIGLLLLLQRPEFHNVQPAD